MSEGRQFPPPGGFPPPPGPPVSAPGAGVGDAGPAGGWPGSAAAAPAWPAYAGNGAIPPPGMAGPVHRPGAVPLRPLNLGAMYDGAFRIIRYNPKATVGATVLVSSVLMLIPVLVSALTSSLTTSSYDPADANPTLGVGDAVSVLSLVVGLYATQIGLVFVTGMVAHVTRAAAVGRKLTLGEAWAATRGKRWRLIGLALLLALATLVVAGLLAGAVVLVAVVTQDVLTTVLVGLVCLFGYLAALALFWTRVMCLSATALVLEPVGVLGSIGRAVQLTRHQFWRVFGIGLLTALVAGLAGGFIGMPINLVGDILMAVWPQHAFLVLSIAYALSTVASTALTGPFRSAVAALQYLDQRIRKEGYDVELMREAGLLGP